MKLLRYNRPDFGFPASFNALEDFFRHGDRVFGRLPELFARELGETFFQGDHGLSADLYEDDGAYHARFELPGVKKEDVKIEFHQGALTVSYSKGEADGEDKKASETYKRALSVPEDVVAENITAKHEDGLLTVSLPKAESTEARQIEIS